MGAHVWDTCETRKEHREEEEEEGGDAGWTVAQHWCRAEGGGLKQRGVALGRQMERGIKSLASRTVKDGHMRKE